MRVAQSDTVTPPPTVPEAVARGPRAAAAEPLHAEVPTEIPTSVPTEVDGLAAVPGTSAPDVAPGRKPSRFVLLAGVVALAALVAVPVVWTKRSASPNADAPPAPPPAPGTLVIDALPWGEIERIADATGRAWPVGSDRYTPFVASLPPGEYVVSLRHPDAGEPTSVKVTVRSSQRERRVIALRPIDADEYLRKAGF
jgi:hypothetical protein